MNGDGLKSCRIQFVVCSVRASSHGKWHLSWLIDTHIGFNLHNHQLKITTFNLRAIMSLNEALDHRDLGLALHTGVLINKSQSIPVCVILNTNLSSSLSPLIQNISVWFLWWSAPRQGVFFPLFFFFSFSSGVTLSSPQATRGDCSAHENWLANPEQSTPRQSRHCGLPSSVRA